jgi:glutathione S-transferase
MKLYYSPGACSLAVRIVLNELGLSFDAEKVDLREKKTEKGDDFYKINAKGAIPTLTLDNGTVLTESAVIQQYLAETHQNYQLLPEIGDAKRYEVLTWLNYMATEMHKGVGILFNPSIPAEVKASFFIPAVHAKLDFVEKQLQHTKAYIAGSEFTLADGYLFTVLGWLPHFNIDVAKWPALNTFVNTMRTRPSVKLSLTQEGL